MRKPSYTVILGTKANQDDRIIASTTTQYQCHVHNERVITKRYDQTPHDHVRLAVSGNKHHIDFEVAEVKKERRYARSISIDAKQVAALLEYLTELHKNMDHEKE